MKIPKAPPTEATTMLTEPSVDEARKRAVLVALHLRMSRTLDMHAPIYHEKTKTVFSHRHLRPVIASTLLNRVVATRANMRDIHARLVRSDLATGESRDSGRYVEL